LRLVRIFCFERKGAQRTLIRAKNSLNAWLFVGYYIRPWSLYTCWHVCVCVRKIETAFTLIGKACWGQFEFRGPFWPSVFIFPIETKFSRIRAREKTNPRLKLTN
jgi:hypothetical protein